MQSAKGEGLAGSAFGGGGGGGVGQAVFGGRGAASFLSKATTVLAVVFMINCGALAFMSSGTRVGSNYSEVTESAVTRQAQREMELQRQQQQQQMMADSAAQQQQPVSLDDLMAPGEEAAPPTDTGAAGN
jgi:preprotein translocase subunit SecG